jgi:phage-related tail protein
MGRPSKLTPTQWEEVGRRLSAGETAASLSREFQVSETVISKRFSQFPKDTIAKLGKELAQLTPAAQTAAVSLADELRSISGHLAAAARYGSATAHRLQALAHGEVQKIDDADPLQSLDALKGVQALTRVANESAATGLALLGANRDANKGKSDPVPLSLTSDDADG